MMLIIHDSQIVILYLFIMPTCKLPDRQADTALLEAGQL